MIRFSSRLRYFLLLGICTAQILALSSQPRSDYLMISCCLRYPVDCCILDCHEDANTLSIPIEQGQWDTQFQLDRTTPGPLILLLDWRFAFILWVMACFVIWILQNWGSSCFLACMATLTERIVGFPRPTGAGMLWVTTTAGMLFSARNMSFMFSYIQGFG